MDKKKLERLERKVLRRDAQQAVRNIKKSKQENPFKLGAAVAFLPRAGTGKLGQIVKITKSLLTVKWDDGSTEFFGRAGQAFYGDVDETGNPKSAGQRHTFEGKDRAKQLWGTDEDPYLTIATDSVRQTLAEKRKKFDELRAQRQAERARIDADPEYQKRQADLKRFAEMLLPVSGQVENSWSQETNFRIELENIPPEQMEDLIQAIRKVRG
jgi:hypothetical protein